MTGGFHFQTARVYNERLQVLTSLALLVQKYTYKRRSESMHGLPTYADVC
jgi:hypothetical protein